MARGTGLFAGRVRGFREREFSELSQVFGPWVEISERFGEPARKRLFFPLTDVLAVPVPSLGGGPRMPGGGEEVPGLARPTERANRLAEDGGLLQSARTTAPGGDREDQ